MAFSIKYQGIIGNVKFAFLFYYIISVMYEFQQEKNKGDFTVFVTAPFILLYEITVALSHGVYELFTNFGSVSQKFNQFVKSLLSFLKILLDQFWGVIKYVLHFVETIIKAPFELIMNFSQYMEELFRAVSDLIIYLYHFLLSILSPVWEQIKKMLPYLLSFFRFPLRFIHQFGVFLYDLAKAIAKGVARTASSAFSTLFEILKKISQLSFIKFINILLNPFRWLWNLLKMLYYRFNLIPFLKKLFEILIRLPQYIYFALRDLVIFLYNGICKIIRFIAETVIGMFYDIIEFLNIAKYLPEFLKPIAHMIYEVCKYILNLIVKIILLPYRFMVWLLKLLVHPLQTIIDLFYSFIDLLKQIASLILRVIESNIVQFILGIMRVPFDLLMRLLSKLSLRNFLKIIEFPLTGLKYLAKALSSVAKAIYNSVVGIIKSIGNGIVYLFTLLSHFSLRKLIYYLLAPIRWILEILEKLAQIPFLGIFIRIIKIILYTPAWIISFVFRFLIFFIESFINFFSKNMSLGNIIDMWDNVCWPRDSEYCKQILAKAQNNNNFNNDNYNYNDYRYA